MCNAKCILFGAINLDKREIKGKKVIEVGAYDVNGSLRALIRSWKPASYIGVDIEKGKGVDAICRVEDLIKHFGPRQFDVVLCTEVLEHVRNWRSAVSNIKNICRTNGIIIITTRSQGFSYHAFPHDFWRYETGDMMEIFSDCQIEKLERDEPEPGVLLKARVPSNFVEKDLSLHELFSIILEKRCRDVDDRDIRKYQEKYQRAKRNGHRVNMAVAFLAKLFKCFHRQ